MDRGRRASVVKVGIRVAAIGLCLLGAYLLPDGGVLGFIAGALKFVAGVIAVNLALPLWRAIAPESAARWESSGGRPVPLIAPIVFWTATAMVAWILLFGVEPPASRSDYVAMVFMWCVVAGAAAFSVAFTRMYLRDRRAKG